MKIANLCLFLIICIFQQHFLLARVDIKRKLKEKLVEVMLNSNVGFKINRALFNEANLEAPDLIKFYGYPVEIQTATTEDDYMLVIQRIPHGKESELQVDKTGIPVVLLHSLSCQSFQWFDSGPESLAFLLADEGYDVWVANFRGTTFSYHSVYSRDSEEFWNFSLDEFIYYDLPSIIDHVISVTGYSKVILIGHSLGATVSILTLAAKPEYNDKVSGFIAMAPVISPKYTCGLLKFIVNSQIDAIENYVTNSQQYLWNTVDPFLQGLTYKFCPESNPILCEFPSYLLFGYSPYLRNRTRFLINAQHCEMGVPKKIILQSIQVYKNQQINRFDYGLVKNQEKYHSSSPPGYDLNQVTAPGVIFYAPNDCVSTPLDVTILATKIPNLVGKEVFPNPTASHSDFLWAASAKKLVYDKVITYLKKLNK